MPPLDDFALDEKVIVVTGAGRGIGRGIALDAARAGAKVVGCSRTASELETLSEEIASLGADGATTIADVTDMTSLQNLVDFAVTRFGRIDGFVNNAGSNKLRDAIDYSADEVDSLFEINLKAVYWASVLVAKAMIATEVRGVIVNITSQAGVAAAPGRAPYSAAKAGVNHLSRSLASEWARYGIRVNSVAPTVTATALAAKIIDERPDFAAEVNQRIILVHRPASIEEISHPVIFLLSEAARLITGQTLVVDGGWTL